MLEAGFLILLAVVVGLADLSPALIILVMAVAWLLVAMIEYFAWRQGPGFAAAGRYTPAVEPARAEVHEQVVEEAPPPPPPRSEPTPALAPAEDETMVAPAAPAPAEEEPQEPATFLAEPEKHVRHRLEPLEPRPRRRWGLFGPRVRVEEPAEDSREEEQ